MINSGKRVVASLVAFCLVTSSAGALDLASFRPEHDWTFGIGDTEYGLQGYSGRTDILLASHRLSLPLPFYPTVGAGLALFVGVTCLGLWTLSRRRLK